MEELKAASVYDVTLVRSGCGYMNERASSFIHVSTCTRLAKSFFNWNLLTYM